MSSKRKTVRKTAASRTGTLKRYAYTMHVTEIVESTYVIESDRQLTFNELADRTERARKAGKLTLEGVSNVETYCERATKDGQEDREAIAV